MTVKQCWSGFGLYAGDMGKDMKAKMQAAVLNLLGHLIAVDTMDATYLEPNADVVGGADFKGNPTEYVIVSSSKRAVMFFGCVFFLDFVRRTGTTRAEGLNRAHVGVHRTRGEPNEIELTATDVLLNGRGQVRAARLRPRPRV